MTKWCGILPVAMWAGSVSLPAHALQVVAGPLAGAVSSTADDLCARGLAPLPAARECALAVEPWAHDPSGYAVFPATLAYLGPDPVGRSGVDATVGVDARGLLTQPDAGPVLPRGMRAGWAAQVLVGLAAVGLVARRRLVWYARSATLSAPPLAASTSRTPSARHPAHAAARPLAARVPARAVPGGRYLA